MEHGPTETKSKPRPLVAARSPSGDEERWEAVVRRDSCADETFVYSVKTTGVFCRPSCPSRLPHRGNVRFHKSCEEAEAAGFRPCKRCQPTGSTLREQYAETVAKACAIIQKAEEMPALGEIAKAVGMSPYHFHRVFKKITGLTPKAYATAHRAERLRQALPKCDTVTEAIYEAGFKSNSRFYAKSSEILGMSPNRFRAGGTGMTIRFAVGECSLGSILVACSDKGVCAILMGDDPDALLRDLQDRFSRADFVGGDPAFEKVVAKVVGHIENPQVGLDLPIDVRGTAFQQKVWDALRRIPTGKTATYTEIANQIGLPNAIRAVAGACAANPVAVAIPCHRVVRTDGNLSGYRWGVERKRALLKREQQNVKTPCVS